MKQPDNAIHILSQLRILGISIALDDFGTGYSSLSYLKRFPLDKLKIDRSFIRDLPGNTDDITITNAIIATAKHFNLITVAEGIENAEQAEFLAQIGCQQGQGYFYAKPITAQDMRHRIHQKTTGRPALVQF